MKLLGNLRSSGESNNSSSINKRSLAYTFGLAGILALLASCTEGSQGLKNYINKPGVENAEISEQDNNTIANRKFGDIFNKLLGEGSNARIIECPHGKITLSKGKDYRRIEISRNNSDDIYILCEEGGSYIYKGYKGKVLEYKDGDNESCFDFLSKIIKEINCAYGREIFDPKIDFEKEIKKLDTSNSIHLTLPNDTKLTNDSINLEYSLKADKEFNELFNCLFEKGSTEVTDEKSILSTITIKKSDKTEPIGGVQSKIRKNNNRYINFYLYDYGNTPGISVGLTKEDGKYDCRFNSSNHVESELDPDSGKDRIHIDKKNVSPEDLLKILQYLKQFEELLDNNASPEDFFKNLKQLENLLNNIELNRTND